MKRALRIIIPILLALAVLGCAAWYLLVYDQEFTRDMLLSQARNFERSGNHKAAAWLYDVAYFQSSQEDSVAIELAQQYKASGNYTKAEYTLSEAISENATAQLYAALCATYVEQDKLLDAVNLLDTISDPQIKTELDAQRPAAPTVSPAPGFYSQYLSVAVESTGGTLYISTSGEYPSTANGAYTQPITLPGGETVIYALAVDDNLLVSPLRKFGYTIRGVIEEVTFTDAAMEQAIRTALGVGETEVLFTDDLWNITEFTVPADAGSYEDLASLTYLRRLTAENASQDGLQAISSLSSLEELVLKNCRISDEVMTAIGSLSGLQQLTMENCSLSTIEALNGLTKLVSVDLSGNTLRNISGLSGMTGLQTLDLSENALTDLTALSSLGELKTLNVSYNSLTTLDPILSCTDLLTLDASHNQIATIDNLGGLTSLGNLNLSHNQLTDISPLSGSHTLVELDVSNNTLADLSALDDLINLSKLNFAYNQVEALPSFAAECALVTIDGSYNKLSSLEPLAGLSMLNNVLMDYNEKLSSLSPLDKCPVLVQVNAYGTNVKEVTFLLDKSVIVNFDPSR